MQDTDLLCGAAHCGRRYPVLNGIPVLINEQNSVFSIDDFRARRVTTLLQARPGPLKRVLESALGTQRYVAFKRFVRRTLPTIDKNVRGERNYKRLLEMLLQRPGRPRVLVLGGGIVGDGMHELLSSKAIDFFETDVSFGPQTKLICDGHDLPFEDGTFDAVIAQAVLEHVVDPYRCVSEIHRVLNDSGLMYAETPFMQQVHAGRYDFTRWTHLGHRRLFRHFEEIESGAVCGPGMALAWAYQYFLFSFASSDRMRSVVRLFAAFTAFPLKYLDPYLIDRKGTYDAASGFYLFAVKSDKALSDKDLLAAYRGLDSL